MKRSRSNPAKIEKIKTSIFVFLRKEKSMKEKAKNTAKEITIHISWWKKKGVSFVKEDIVTSPKPRIGNIKITSSQSTPFFNLVIEFFLRPYIKF